MNCRSASSSNSDRAALDSRWPNPCSLPSEDTPWHGVSAWIQSGSAAMVSNSQLARFYEVTDSWVKA
eukprot:scaffold129132_cov32-Prasinocladus_malaysianus.AAC.1